MAGAEGQIYTWGFCTHGQLGLKETILGAREYVETPTNVGVSSALSNRVLQAAACGHFHTLVVDLRGNVYSFGRNDRGQLGHGGDDDCEALAGTGSVPRHVKSLSRSIVVDVACGAFHCLARTADGVAFSWGWNKFGQLGRSTGYQTDSCPGAVCEVRDAMGTMRSFAAGFAHSAAVLSSGQVIVWGSNEMGQLGVGSAVKHPEVAITPLFASGVVGKQVASGDNHLLVLTIDGTVVAAGDSSYGRLGLGEESPVAAKNRAGCFGQVLGLPGSEDMGSDRIHAIAAGGATSAAVSTAGRLFTWGGGAWGQLGLGDCRDHKVATLVQRLQGVRHIDVAQDHMLAVCVESQRQARHGHPGSRTEGHLDGDSGSVDEDDCIPSSLWVWGRRRLLPNGLGDMTSDPECQNVPIEVPLERFGLIGTPQQELGIRLHGVCGGSHSLVFGAPAAQQKSRKTYVAAWCPKMSTVTGPGTKGGRVSESLAFRITARNADGKDEKVGGLRFRVWASPIAGIQPRRRGGTDDEACYWDKHPFELQRLSDSRDGTYEGAYIVRRAGPFFLHVNMLPNDAEQRLADDVGGSVGEPLSGSPFRVTIDSGPASAPLCVVHLRSVVDGAARRSRKRSRSEPGVGNASNTVEMGLASRVFTVEACSEATWDIFAYDVLGNAGTLKTDKFAAHITPSCENKAQNSEPTGTRHAERNLASSMGLPEVSKGRSMAAAAMRERVRQRTAERLWVRMSNSSSLRSPATASSGASPKEASLHVQQTKELGKSQICWTPNAVGRYSLAVTLLDANTGKGMPVGCSPFEVIVVPGLPSAQQSQLLVGLAAIDCDKPPDADEKPFVLTWGESPPAEIPVRLLMCDRNGNICRDYVDALKYINVRVESLAINGRNMDHLPGLLEWRVAPIGSSGLLILSLKATPALLTAAAEAVENRSRNDVLCIVSIFISATDRASHKRLLGSPWRMQFELEPLMPDIAVPTIGAVGSTTNDASASGSDIIQASGVTGNAEDSIASQVTAAVAVEVPADCYPIHAPLLLKEGLPVDEPSACNHTTKRLSPLGSSRSIADESLPWSEETRSCGRSASEVNLPMSLAAEGVLRSVAVAPRSVDSDVSPAASHPISNDVVIDSQVVGAGSTFNDGAAAAPYIGPGDGASSFKVASAHVARSVVARILSRPEPVTTSVACLSAVSQGRSEAEEAVSISSSDPLLCEVVADPPPVPSPLQALLAPPAGGPPPAHTLRTPPATGRGPSEWRSLLVQLPPLCKTSPVPGTAESPMDSPEDPLVRPSVSRSSPAASRASSAGSTAMRAKPASKPLSPQRQKTQQGQAQTSNEGGNAMAWIPIAGLVSPERQGGGCGAGRAHYVHACPHHGEQPSVLAAGGGSAKGARRRRQPSLQLGSGLVTRDAPLLVPSPWPQIY